MPVPEFPIAGFAKAQRVYGLFDEAAAAAAQASEGRDEPNVSDLLILAQVQRARAELCNVWLTMSV